MERDYRFCDEHPGEPVIHCDLCMQKMRIEIRKECIDLAEKMEKYREEILGPRAKKDEEWP